MKSIKRYVLIISVMVLTMILTSGCGNKTEKVSGSVTSFTLNEDGTVRHCIVDETFEGMDKADFEAFVNSEIDSYNNGSEEPKVSLVSLDISGTEAKIVMDYSTVYDYATFNKVATYMGTVEGALGAGFIFDKSFDYDGNVSVSGYTIPAEYPWLNILIVKEPMQIKLPKEAIFVSDSVERTGKGIYTVTEDYDMTTSSVFQTTNNSFSYLIY